MPAHESTTHSFVQFASPGRRERMHQPWKYDLLALKCLLLTMLFALDLSASELLFSDDYRLSEMREMPRPASASGIRFEHRSYPEDNAIEWRVGIAAPSNGESPLFEDVKSADFVVRFPTESATNVHWNKGSHAEDSDFQPRIDVLSVGKPFVLESFGGRSSDGAMPYFNLARGDGGIIVAIGWPGDWQASFESLNDSQVRVVAGLKRSKFRLRLGESFQLPSILVMGYRGDPIDGQNQFRRLMLRHFTPKNHPPMELMPVAASVHGMFGFNVTSEANLTKLAEDIAALQLPLDTYWLDAGWNEGGFPTGQGNPQPDPERFPRGLAPLGETVRRSGMRFLVWFEPERAMRGTWLDREHPNWLLSPGNTPDELRYLETDGFRLLDFGEPQARQWALDTISRQIRDAGIAVYRQDFNAYPSYFWWKNEAPEEIGLREVRYVNGLYAFLDELTRRHPSLILDNCASGGRRLDFEMMRRCVALWRSDSCWDAKSFPRNMQAMTHGLSHWLPLHGVGALTADNVALRSGMGTCASYAINYRDPAAVESLREHLSRYRRVRSLFAADFYPLTDWSDDPAKWLAFQFHDPATGKGIVQAFCGARATDREMRLKLKGLDPHRQYEVTDWDQSGETIRRSGNSLVSAGIDLRATNNSNTAIVLEYTAVDRHR